MIKSVPSLFTKILSWFFLNLILLAGSLTFFFSFQPQVNLHAMFGKQISHRLRTAGMLISHDLAKTPRKNWSQLLVRHGKIQQVDFALILADGTSFSSTGATLPEAVVTRARWALQLGPPPDEIPPHLFFAPDPLRQNNVGEENKGDSNNNARGTERQLRPTAYVGKPHLMMKTQNPKRYWTGIKIPLPHRPLLNPKPVLLLVESDSVTGNGFFFSPLPGILFAGLVLLISVIFWIPLVRNITKPLARITLAAEKIAGGRFDIAIHEPRTDEIGRLARSINHMTSRLTAFVTGQKRFLGDVAHELGSPISRIQLGLGILEQRTTGENKQRVKDVLEDVDHMSQLVNELLSFSRAEVNRKAIKLVTVNLLQVVQNAVKRETTSGISIITEIDPGIRVTAASELLTRAVANLIRNATQYAGNDQPIFISAHQRKKKVTLTIRDTGPGVPEDDLDQLFEPFFRPEPSRDRNSGGVGLGLAIVKTCIETCQGTVSAHNGTPNGFIVTVILNTRL
jgi:two-component system sensor histidine kinase CpxA